MEIEGPEGPGAEQTLAEDRDSFSLSMVISLFSDCCSASVNIGSSALYLSRKSFGSKVGINFFPTGAF